MLGDKRFQGESKIFQKLMDRTPNIMVPHVGGYVAKGVSKNSRFSIVYVHKESSLIWSDPFLVQDIYRL